MNCREFEEHLQTLLDGDGAGPEAVPVREHREACPVCRELYAAARQLRRGLAAMPVPAVPEGFSQRVAARLLLRPRMRLTPRWWLAAAASVLVAGLSLWGVRLWLGNPGEPGPVVKAPKPPSLRQEFAEAGNATLRLTRGFARDAADHAGILVPPADRLPAPSLPPRVDPGVVPLREAGRTVASGLEPVTHSAKRAWDMIVRELPDWSTP